MKYNRNRNVFTTQFEIPDFDVEAGVKIGMTDSSTKGKAITIEINNKNVPQLSLTGRAKWVNPNKKLVQTYYQKLCTNLCVFMQLFDMQALTRLFFNNHRLQAMTDGMMEIQLLVPSLRTDATITATAMNNAEGLTMEIKSDVKLPETSSIQAVTFKYGESD